MKTRILTRPVVLVAALAVVAMMALAACGSPSPTDADAGSSGSPSASATPSAGGSAATTTKISIQDFSFSPSTATVTAGTTVTWTNDEAAVHDVTSTDGPGTDAATTSTFASETLSQGDSFSFTFETPGTYYYECTIHASMATMHGVVIVE
jgi:plastocyanin